MKAKEPVASTSKEVKSVRGRKRAADSQPPQSASPEKSAKVLRAEKIEVETKPKVLTVKASPKSVKVLKKNGN